PGHLYELSLDLAVEIVAALLVDEVPLVEGDDQRAPCLGDRADDAGVLLGQRHAAVDDDDRDLGPIDRRARAQARVVLMTRRITNPPTDARGVDEVPRAPAQLDDLVDGVDGRA